MSAAGDVIRVAQSASGAFPPLQAALSLVSYIDESIALFKSNKNEIQAIGSYSQQLSEQLQRYKPADPRGVENFCRVITDIHGYVKQSTKKHTLVQFFNRQAVADQLQSYRNQLRQHFELFSVTSDIDVLEAQRAAEAARRADTAAVHQELCTVSRQITTAIGLSQFATAYGLSKIQSSTRVMYKELQVKNTYLYDEFLDEFLDAAAQGISEVERTREETIVLQESLQLSEVLFKSDYRWFSSTFKAKLTESDVKGVLVELISDIVTDLNDAKLLAGTTRIQLLHQEDELKKVTMLFRALNMRSRDAVFIRSFQRAVHRHQSKVSQNVLNDRLKFEEISEEEDEE
ncbi:hypothetical protein C8R45DRAFT_1181689 [Mycena sanguinolenta]|nr:hypothetical protein C8R45DRAFT_1181689 [Mycena sanguinolenta]